MIQSILVTIAFLVSIYHLATIFRKESSGKNGKCGGCSVAEKKI